MTELKAGQLLSEQFRDFEFTLWPTRHIQNELDLNFRVYVTDPWPFLDYYVRRNSRKGIDGSQDALHFLRQAEDYYRAATSASNKAAQPVLCYYSFLNLVKSAVLCRNNKDSFEWKDKHGLTVKKSKNLKLEEQDIDAFPTGEGQYGYSISMFDELLGFLGAERLKTQMEFSLAKILPQILMGHRLWAAGVDKCERFCRINNLMIMVNDRDQAVWLRIAIDNSNLERCKITGEDILQRTMLGSGWTYSKYEDGRTIICEQRESLTYSSSPLERLQELANSIRSNLWQAAVLSPPYRKYYLYSCPQNENSQVLPQLASIYIVSYFLSSITRYRPSEYRKHVSSELGSFIVGFMNDCPKQFIYLLASEMAQRELSSGDQI